MIKWTKHEREQFRRPNEKAARIIALFLLDDEDRLVIDRKGEFAKLLGISRHTLDRDLTTLEAAKVLAKEYKRRIENGIPDTEIQGD